MPAPPYKVMTMRLPVSAIALLYLSACSAPAEQATSDGPQAKATIHELMAEVIAPQAEVLWNANAVLSDETGIHELSPRSEEDWNHLRAAAVILGEAQNLLVMPGRKIMPEGEPLPPDGTLAEAEILQRIGERNADFRTNALAMQGLALEATAAIDAKDLARLDEVGGRIDQVCEQCHLQFWYPPEGQ